MPSVPAVSPDAGNPFPDQDWLDISRVWQTFQELMPRVQRWKSYCKEDPSLRKQDSMQHTASIALLAIMFVQKLAKHVDLDMLLILEAFIVHDQSEGELHRDVQFNVKTEDHDLAEYLAFEKRYNKLQLFWSHMQRIYLLQFCLESPASFPEDAQEVMTELRRKNRREALAFMALEHWEYFLYALEQYREKGNRKVLYDVIVKSQPYFERLARELRGFEAEVWTSEISQWCKQFVLRCVEDNIPLEAPSRRSEDDK